MSKYTTELGHIIESGFDLGLKNYPIFSEEYRASLNEKIFEHYFFREIAFETAARFKRNLNRKMNEIMPYYNQLYLSVDPELEWKITRYTEEILTSEGHTSSDGTTESKRDDTGESTTDSTDTSKNLSHQNGNVATTTNSEQSVDTTTTDSGETVGRQVYSDTPQNILSIDGAIDQAAATNATFTNNDASNTNTGKSTTTLDGTESQETNMTSDSITEDVGNSKTDTTFQSVNTGNTSTTGTTNATDTRLSKGRDAALPDLLEKYRATFLNIDLLIIYELKDLFFNLY